MKTIKTHLEPSKTNLEPWIYHADVASVSRFVIIQFFPWRMTDDKAGQVESELSARGMKQDYTERKHFLDWMERLTRPNEEDNLSNALFEVPLGINERWRGQKWLPKRFFTVRSKQKERLGG